MAKCRELFPRCASCGNAGSVQAVALRLKINPDAVGYAGDMTRQSFWFNKGYLEHILGL